MKKLTVFLLTLTLTVTFCFSRRSNGQTKEKSLITKPGRTIQTITPGNVREKREHYLRLKKQMQELAAQCPVVL